MKTTLTVINQMQAESGTLISDKLDSILSRYGLLAKWEEFGNKFLKRDL